MRATRSVASNPVVRYVADALRFYMEFHARYDGFYGAFIHDPLAVAAALDRSLVTTEALYVDVETRGEITTGMTVADCRRLTAGRRTSTSRSAPMSRASSTRSSSASVDWRRATRTWHARNSAPRRPRGGVRRRTTMGWLSRQFTTRVIVLMPIAIAINIVLGYTVQTVLKLPDLPRFDRDDPRRRPRRSARGRRDRDPVEPDLAVRPGHRRRHDRAVRDHRRRDRPAGRRVGLARRLPVAARLGHPADRRGRRCARSLVILVVHPDPQQPGLHRSRTSVAIPSWVYTAAIVHRDHRGGRGRPASSISGATWPACGWPSPAS